MPAATPSSSCAATIASSSPRPCASWPSARASPCRGARRRPRPGPATGCSRSWSGPRAGSRRGSGTAPEAERARAYLESRGIDRETARAFRLGYAPEGWDHLLGAARREGHPVEALLAAGLVIPRQNASGHYDRFRGRLIFPIADTQGRVIAFGGRGLAGEEPKYLNSPETPLYQKGQTLYSLHRARERMTETRRALLVEGYVDCLMAHQHGFGEAVAVLGTALTPQQLGLLRRYADEAILFFDADRAGQEAARRAEDLLERSADPQWWALTRRPDTLARRGLRLRVATLPVRPRPRHLPPRRGRRGPRGRLPRRPAAPPLRARPRVLRGGHGEPARPRHRQRPRRAHAVEGAGRRRGDRARARGGPPPRRRPERPLAPGAAPGRGGRSGRRRRRPRRRRRRT